MNVETLRAVESTTSVKIEIDHVTYDALLDVAEAAKLSLETYANEKLLIAALRKLEEL